MTKAQADEAILFPEVMVGKYVVRPWTLQQAVEVAPIVGAILRSAKGAGVGDLIERLLGLAKEAREGKDINEESLTGDFLSSLIVLVPDIVPSIPKILTASLRIPEEEANDIPLGHAIELLISVVTVNVDYLKNYFGPRKATANASA